MVPSLTIIILKIVKSWCSHPEEPVKSIIREQGVSWQKEDGVHKNRYSQPRDKLKQGQEEGEFSVQDCHIVEFSQPEDVEENRVRRQDKSSHLDNRAQSNKLIQQGYRVARKQVKSNYEEYGAQGRKYSQQGSRFKSSCIKVDEFNPQVEDNCMRGDECSHSGDDKFYQQEDVFITSWGKLESLHCSQQLEGVKTKPKQEDKYSQGNRRTMDNERSYKARDQAPVREVLRGNNRHMLPNHKQPRGGGDQTQQRIRGDEEQEPLGEEEAAEDQDNAGGEDQVQQEGEEEERQSYRQMKHPCSVSRSRREMEEEQRKELSTEEEAM